MILLQSFALTVGWLVGIAVIGGIIFYLVDMFGFKAYLITMGSWAFCMVWGLVYKHKKRLLARK